MPLAVIDVRGVRGEVRGGEVLGMWGGGGRKVRHENCFFTASLSLFDVHFR